MAEFGGPKGVSVAAGKFPAAHPWGRLIVEWGGVSKWLDWHTIDTIYLLGICFESNVLI